MARFLWQVELYLISSLGVDGRLRILAYFPRTKLSPGIAAPAMVIVANAACQTLHLFGKLHALGQLNPSWPQLKRFSHCGQVIILAYLSGNLNHTEVGVSMRDLLYLLEGHVRVIPSAVNMADGFRLAVAALGKYWT